MEKTSLSDLYSCFLKSKIISTDSREITPGCIFFALKGDRFNGNLFASDALEKGAAFAIVDEELPKPDPRLLLVDDVLKALQDMAMLHRRNNQIPLIAVTGTNGKTTTKELIAAVLSAKYNTLFTQGNLNNHIGVPRTILSILAETEIAVVEMGANHIGEISNLCSMAMPGFGIITNIGRAHLEGFGDFEGVIQAKTELYRHIRNSNGTLFVHADDPLLMQLSSGTGRITYGSAPEAHIRGTLLTEGPFTGVLLETGAARHKITTNLFGSYNAPNILAAVAVGMHFGIEIEAIRKALEGYTPVNNRSQLKKTPRNTLILDAYNANPSSMSAALKHFASLGNTAAMIILGDMLELGAESEEEHARIIRLIDELKFNDVILVGPVFSGVYKGSSYKTFASGQEALEYLRDDPPSGKMILIKGSRGLKMEVVTGVL